ncbi:MAG: TNT domain-containing protein, partial [Erysipelothrix sp.]
ISLGINFTISRGMKNLEKMANKWEKAIDFRNMTQEEFFSYLDDNNISLDDLSKVTDWSMVPDLVDYAKYKDVYDNSKYFDQATGDIKWPGQYGDINTDGFLNGIFENSNLTPGQVIDRYGSNYGTFFADIEASIPERAMAPGSNFDAYNQYEILKEIPVREGIIAPWFNQPGGGIQYMLDPDFVKTIKSIPGNSEIPFIDILIDLGYLKRL